MKKYFIFVIFGILATAVVFLNFQPNNQNAEREVDFGHGLSVISFSSPHCGACAGVKKEVEKVRSELEDDAVFETVDVTKDTQTTDYYHVTVVPTIIITYDGMEVGRLTGTKIATELSSAIKKEIGRPKYCEDGTMC